MRLPRLLATTLARLFHRSSNPNGQPTIEELHEHRYFLFLSLVQSTKGWKSKLQSDGSSIPGWFIAGTHIGGGQLTLHIPERLWELGTTIKVLKQAPEQNSNRPDDLLERLLDDLEIPF